MDRKLPDWINGYLQYTSNSEPPLLYQEWSAVSIIASALQRKVFLEWGELTFYPNMYIVLVGPSGKCRKGTAMSVSMKFLKHIGLKVAAESITREALVRELYNSMTTHVDAVTGKATFHSSLTIFSPELVVFLGYGNLSLMSDLTDWYDCRDRWVYRTKNSGSEEIDGVWVNLIGATTPELVQNALPQDAIGGGLASRIIFVYEDNKRQLVPAPFLNKSDKALGDDLKLDLEAIHTISGNVIVTEEFVDKWTEWYIHQDTHPPFNDTNFDGYIQRRPNHVLKLCIILAASMGKINNTGTLVVDEIVLARAIDLLNRTEVKMPRTFMGFGQSDLSAVTSKMMSVIMSEGDVARSRLLQMFYADLNSAKQLDDLISVLTNMGFCTQLQRGTSGPIIVRFNPAYKP